MKNLKYWLIGIAITSLGIAGHSSAFEYYFSPHDDYVFLSGSSYMFVKPGSGNTNKIDFYPSPGNCEWFVKVDATHTYCYRYGGTILSVDSSAKRMIWRGNYEIYCSDLSSCILDLESRDDINVLSGMSNCPECQECETCPSTGDILSGYIAINDITTNYCVSNDLCPEMSGGNSALYINDIRHQSMPFINIYIPEEIQRDYEYTGNGTQIDISVEGYGYDEEAMQNMVNTQRMKPTDEDMSNLISKVADFLPLIAVALLIIRLRRVLKKVFRF